MSTKAFKGQLENFAILCGEADKEISIRDAAAISIAVSLKRIADVLDGTALGLLVTETIFNPATVQARNNY